MKRRRRRKEVSSREWGTKAKRGSCEVMKFEKESIFMQILNERRRKKRERERKKKIQVGNLFTNQGNRKQSVKVDGSKK